MIVLLKGFQTRASLTPLTTMNCSRFANCLHLRALYLAPTVLMDAKLRFLCGMFLSICAPLLIPPLVLDVGHPSGSWHHGITRTLQVM